MPRKALRIQIELDLQAVTCPGVWLCPNGKVSLQVYMIDSCIQTTALPPVFPLLYHEQFIFYKTFYSAHTLMDLQRFIDKDFLYAELVQWQNGDVGNVIASFQTSLHEVLYPSANEGTLSGVDVDLLMEPSKSFPGIIAPKIEISTRTTVEEVLCTNDRKQSSTYVVNPKTIPSDYVPCDLKRKNKLPRQKKVCHSVEYHRSRKCLPSKKVVLKPPFIFRKAEDALLSRKPQGTNDHSSKKCKCRACQETSEKLFQVRKLELSPRGTEKKTYTKVANTPSEQCFQVPERKTKRDQKCSCGSGHSAEDCPVCSKYKNYFDNGGVIDVETGNAFVRKVTSDKFRNEYDDRKPEKSPVRSSRKACHCSNTPKSHLCSPKSYDTNEIKEYEYKESERNPQCNNKFCVRCSLTRKPSLAKQIHNRLMQTLDFCTPNQCDERHERSSGSITACCSPKFRNCDRGFYKNLGKFYKELYRC